MLLSGNAWPVVFANQNIPRLEKPYVQLNVMNIDIPDHVIYSIPDASGKVMISGWRKASVEIQIFNGINSLTTVSQIAMILQSTAMLDYQVSIDCAIGQRLFIGYVPELINLSQWEGRGIYQFEFYYTESMDENTGTIDTVTLHGDYLGSVSDPDITRIFDPQPINTNIVCDETVESPDVVMPLTSER
jgi:hypothetical protein